MAVAPGIHIVEEFEKSFQDCLAALTNFDLHNARDPDEIRTSVDLTIQRFLDVSKQMDCFFLQKRLLLSVQKPEHLLVENIQELAAEVKRKDELIEKYNNKIQTWQTLLQDASGGTPRQPLPAQPQPPPPPPPPNVTTLQGSPSQMPPQVVQQPGAATHSHHMMHPHNIPPMTSSPAPIQPGMVMQSQQMHPQQHMGGAQQQGGLQGPLAYLERTMSNIGHL
ncbi:mediator of RNA polymerase II transcription subunit 28 [Caerostris darwini]|uniref:Mediator of RNA polymerase II transcription subunit 28 n=1 Tax=Caerostris darwini TaxID=1538125 RepID=A0AAV4X144_9ARAC|nr:mediator of RNA polymerase II transcription subunit 28 [Caerostris darwini]